MIYKAAYLYDSGAIECGDRIIADTDIDAAFQCRERAIERHARPFGLHEDRNGLIRPVDYLA